MVKRLSYFAQHLYKKLSIFLSLESEGLSGCFAKEFLKEGRVSSASGVALRRHREEPATRSGSMHTYTPEQPGRQCSRFKFSLPPLFRTIVAGPDSKLR